MDSTSLVDCLQDVLSTFWHLFPFRSLLGFFLSPALHTAPESFAITLTPPAPKAAASASAAFLTARLTPHSCPAELRLVGNLDADPCSHRTTMKHIVPLIQA